jgi:large subunit ribosomal protein L23
MSAAKIEKAAKADKSAAPKADKKVDKKVDVSAAETTAKVAKPAKVKKAKVVEIKDAAKKVASPERLINILIAPHITEKTSLAMQNNNSYAFRVLRDSTKPQIKAAVELMFGVKVANVNVVNETGKTRRMGKVQGRTQDIKKAYVRLAPGQTIDYEAKLKA